MTTLVIGGCGFIGSHIVDRLAPRGPTRVLDHRRERFRPAVPQVAYVDGSWLDAATLGSALAGVDRVIHLGWSSIPQSSNLDPAADAERNVVGSLRLLDACVGAGVKRVVFASSGGTVYGPSDRLPLDESHPTAPISAYGIAKLAVEKYLDLYHRLHGLSTLSLRVSNPYGPRQDPERSQGAVAVFAQRLLRRQPIEIWGDGGTVRDYLAIDDAADAFVLASAADAHGALNIGSGTGVSLTELVRALERQAGVAATVSYRPARAVDVPAVVLDRQRAERSLGWRPRIGFADGLQQTIAWLRARAGAGAAT